MTDWVPAPVPASFDTRHRFSGDETVPRNRREDTGAAGRELETAGLALPLDDRSSGAVRQGLAGDRT